ncbi:MAG: polyprenyl diphosphate synthase, partial [Thermodesulfobacteriota bacterium]
MKGKLESLLNNNNLPGHIVIIMDGNGRWARRKGLDRISGHREGMKSVKSVVRTAKELGIKAVTLYAFSAQNWRRPKDEVDALMELLKQYLIKEGNTLAEKGIKLNAIGRLWELPTDVHQVLEEITEKTMNCRE